MVLDKWSSDDDKKGKGIGSKFRSIFKSNDANGTQRFKFEEAKNKLQLQINKLNAIYLKLEEKDKNIYIKIKKALKDKNHQAAIVFANELAQVRNLKRVVGTAKMAFEQLSIRMSTISDLSEIVSTLSPALTEINKVKSSISTLMPEVSNEFSEATNLINEIMLSSSNTPAGIQISNTLESDEETKKILEEAYIEVEKNVENKLPELPSNMKNKTNVKSNIKYPDLPSAKSKKIGVAI